MEPKDPRTLSDDDLERRLREEAHQRFNAELWVRPEQGEWAVGFKLHTTPIRETDPGSVLHQEIVAADRRHALEQVWLQLDGRAGRTTTGLKTSPSSLVTPRTPGITSRYAPPASDFSQERLLRLFTTAPGAFWRHDVDVSLSAAVKMARFAQVAGIQATFYLNPRSDFYNPFNREGAAAVAAILEAGHRLGLHCDYRDGYVPDVVGEDFALLRAGHPGRFEYLVSFHMPPACVLWTDFDGFENAYASKWEGRYLSDSRREFGPEKEALVSDDMQICLHAEHWFA